MSKPKSFLFVGGTYDGQVICTIFRDSIRMPVYGSETLPHLGCDLANGVDSDFETYRKIAILGHTDMFVVYAHEPLTPAGVIQLLIDGYRKAEDEC